MPSSTSETFEIGLRWLPLLDHTVCPVPLSGALIPGKPGCEAAGMAVAGKGSGRELPGGTTLAKPGVEHTTRKRAG